MRKTSEKAEPKVALLPCPLCGSEVKDLGHGISCTECGLWLGRNTAADRRGGHIKVWNDRNIDRSQK